MKILKLENSLIYAEIIPALGGRIDKLIYKPREKNWVWKNKHLTNKYVSKFSDYDSNWQGGWEELFPNDAIEEFSWGKGLDHGELWSTSWNVDNHTNTQIDLSTKQLDSGVIFKKTFKLNENRFICQYNSKIQFNDNFLFKLHLAIPIENNLEIFTDATEIESVDRSFGNIIVNNLNFFKLDKNSGLFDFAYILNTEKKVTVIDYKGGKLELSYGNNNLNHLWMFQTQGGWNNHNVIVLEPASNSKKLISEAIVDNNCLRGPSDFSCFYEVALS